MAAQQHADPHSHHPQTDTAATDPAEADPFAPHRPLDDRPLPSEAEVRAFEKHTVQLIDHGRARLDEFIASDEAELEKCGLLEPFKKAELKARLRVWTGLKATLAPIEERHRKFTAEYREAVCAHQGLAQQRDEASAEAARLTEAMSGITAAVAAVEAELSVLAQKSMAQRRKRDVAVTNHAAADTHTEQLRAEVAELRVLEGALATDVTAAKERVVAANGAAKSAAEAFASASAAHESAKAVAASQQQQQGGGDDAAAKAKAEKAAILTIAVDMAEIDGGVDAFKKAAASVKMLTEAVADTTAQLSGPDVDDAAAAKLEHRLGNMQTALAANRRVVNAVNDNVETARRRHALNVKKAARRSGGSASLLEAAALQAEVTAARDAQFKADREARAAAQELAAAEVERRRLGARMESANARLVAFEAEAAKAAAAAESAEAAAADLVGSSDEHAGADWWNAARKDAMARRAALLDKRDATTRGIGKATRLADTLEEKRGTAEVRCRHLQGVLRDQLQYLVSEVERTDKIDHAKAVATLKKDGAVPVEVDTDAMPKSEGSP